MCDKNQFKITNMVGRTQSTEITINQFAASYNKKGETSYLRCNVTGINCINLITNICTEREICQSDIKPAQGCINIVNNLMHRDRLIPI